MTTKTINTVGELRALAAGLETLRADLDGTASLDAALSYTLAALEKETAGAPATSGEIGRRLDEDSARMTRIFDILSNRRRSKGGGGYDVVELRVNQKDRRIREVHLTPKGIKLMKALVSGMKKARGK